MTPEELAEQQNRLHRQSTRMLKMFTPEIKLHRILKPIIKELLADPPDEAPMEAEELRDILDGLPAVDLLCDDTTFSTPLAAISALYKAVHVHGTPVPLDFLNSYPLTSDETEDRPFRMNMWLAALAGAKGRKLSDIIQRYRGHMESRKHTVSQPSRGGVNILETPRPEQRAHFQSPQNPVARRESPVHSYTYTNTEEKQKMQYIRTLDEALSLRLLRKTIEKQSDRTLRT